MLFDELKTLLDNHTERGAFGMRLTNLKDDVKDVASYLEAMSTAEMNLRQSLTPIQEKALTEMLTKAYRAFQTAHGKHVVDVVTGGTKQSKMNTGGINGNERQNESGDDISGRRGDPDDGRFSGIDSAAGTENKNAFARRVAKVSEQLRLSKATESIRHDRALSVFDGYTTIAAFSQEAESFIMFVLPKESMHELAQYRAAASQRGIKLGGAVLHRLYGYLSVVRLGYGIDKSVTILAADPGSFGESLLQQKGVLGKVEDRTGRTLNRLEGVSFSQNIA